VNAPVGHMEETDEEGGRRRGEPTDQERGGQSLTRGTDPPIGYGRCGPAVGRAKTAGRGRSGAAVPV
jgi:hypothetical protein